MYVYISIHIYSNYKYTSKYKYLPAEGRTAVVDGSKTAKYYKIIIYNFSVS